MSTVSTQEGAVLPPQSKGAWKSTQGTGSELQASIPMILHIRKQTALYSDAVFSTGNCGLRQETIFESLTLLIHKMGLLLIIPTCRVAMRVSRLYKKHPWASHWHRISAHSVVAAIVSTVIVFRFLPKAHRRALTSVAQLVEHHPAKQKVISLILRARAWVACLVSSWSTCERQLIDVSLTHQWFSPSLSPSLPPL